MTNQLFTVKNFNSFGVVIDRLNEQSIIKEIENIDLMDMYTVLYTTGDYTFFINKNISKKLITRLIAVIIL